MPTTYNDQALGGGFDPGVPPPLPASVTVISITFLDQNDDGNLSPGSGDQVNGSDITQVWVGDTVTLNGTVITGTTFYTEDGSRYFTPNDGSALSPGTVTAVTFVTTSTFEQIDDLRPPCFVAGTLIAVPGGTVAVETLQPGDLVLTRDAGPQPVRWIGRQTVPGTGRLAPVRFAPGAIGNPEDLWVSPQHRMLITGWRAELQFGEVECLCPAIALIDGDRVHRNPVREVTYVHILFDTHQIVEAGGVPSESMLVGDYLCDEDSALLREIREIFPEVALGAARDPARPVLRRYEGQLLTDD